MLLENIPLCLTIILLCLNLNEFAFVTINMDIFYINVQIKISPKRYFHSNPGENINLFLTFDNYLRKLSG